jgi:hypothetical protein
MLLISNIKEIGDLVISIMLIDKYYCNIIVISVRFINLRLKENKIIKLEKL